MKKLFNEYEERYTTMEEALVAVIFIPLLVMLGLNITEPLMPNGWFIWLILTVPRVYIFLYLSMLIVLPLYENLKLFIETLADIFKEIADALTEGGTTRKKQ